VGQSSPVTAPAMVNFGDRELDLASSAGLNSSTALWPPLGTHRVARAVDGDISSVIDVS
jgi:hypothetical protein